MNSLKISHLVISLLAASCLPFLTSCGSDSRHTASKQLGEQDTIIKRLVTNWSTGFHEAWTCINTDGHMNVFTFYDKGEVEGLESLYLGTMYSLPPEIEPFHYMWSPLSNQSIELHSPTLGIRDVWTKVAFSDPSQAGEFMQATSADLGQLQCSLEGKQA